MNKKNFSNFFKCENEFLVASIWDDISLALEIQMPIYTNFFVPPQIWLPLINEIKIPNLNIKTFSLNTESEKKVLCFIPKDISFMTENDLLFFKVNGNNRFKKLEHKDFLGTFMSLGIKREQIGDIIVKDNIAYSITFKNVFEILQKNITHINKIPVTFYECSEEDIPPIEFNLLHSTVSSVRLDNIISAILNISRTQTVNLIENGEVLLNYNIEKDKSKVISINDTITIRKKGKFIFKEILGENKKGKLKIIIKQYI